MARCCLAIRRGGPLPTRQDGSNDNGVNSAPAGSVHSRHNAAIGTHRVDRLRPHKHILIRGGLRRNYQYCGSDHRIAPRISAPVAELVATGSGIPHLAVETLPHLNHITQIMLCGRSWVIKNHGSTLMRGRKKSSYPGRFPVCSGRRSFTGSNWFAMDSESCPDIGNFIFPKSIGFGSRSKLAGAA